MQDRPYDESDHDREYSLVLEETRRLKEKHVLNEDPAELAERFFDAIDTLQEICLADYKCSLAFIPVRDDGGVLKGVERTHCAFRGDYDRDDQYWDASDVNARDYPQHSPLPAIMNGDRRRRVPPVCRRVSPRPD